MPGSNTRALEKAKTLAADMLILDLEDAVAPQAKNDARANVVDAVKQQAFGYREVVVRVNDMQSDWGLDDLKAIVPAGPDGVLLPKIVSAEQIAQANQALDDLNASKELGLWIMIEMPLAILNLKEIAEASQSTRLCGFVLGTNDLAKELDCVVTDDRLAFLSALSQSVMAARAYGLTVIDGVYNQIDNDAGLEAECTQGKTLGFDGKSLIHPRQLVLSNQIFAPDAEGVSQAYDVINAFEDPANQGAGVIKVNGKMTERLHLEQARALVSKAEMIKNLGSE